MNSRSSSLLLVLACTGAGAAAHADSFGERTSLVFFLGANAEMPGSFRGQTVPFETADPPGDTVYHDLKFSDAYDDRYTTGAEFDYAVNPNLTAYGRFAYQTFNGQELQVGTWQSTDTLDSHPVSARFNDTNAQQYDVGARYMFKAAKRSAILWPGAGRRTPVGRACRIPECQRHGHDQRGARRG